MLEPQHDAVVAMRRRQALFGSPQTREALVPREPHEPAGTGSQITGADFCQIRCIGHRTLADRIRILEEVTDEAGHTQLVANIRSAADVQRRTVSVDHACVSCNAGVWTRRG
jgi:hypothetical protein